MRILLLDNYDSFTYNLVHYLTWSGEAEVVVKRNDEIAASFCKDFDAVVLSPGPGLPEEAGVMMDLIRYCVGRIPVLGVCLGLQALTLHYGGKLKNLDSVRHGKADIARVLRKDELFLSLPDSFKVGRYHSWCMDKNFLPSELEITMTDEHGEVLAFRHVQEFVHAVQFHPESILTEHGLTIIQNWLRYVNDFKTKRYGGAVS
jgi:anthranilate synthase component 2